MTSETDATNLRLNLARDLAYNIASHLRVLTHASETLDVDDKTSPDVIGLFRYPLEDLEEKAFAIAGLIEALPEYQLVRTPDRGGAYVGRDGVVLGLDARWGNHDPGGLR